MRVPSLLNEASEISAQVQESLKLRHLLRDLRMPPGKQLSSGARAGTDAVAQGGIGNVGVASAPTTAAKAMSIKVPKVTMLFR